MRENFSIAYFKFGTSSVFCRLVQAPYHPLRGIFRLIESFETFCTDVYRVLIAVTKMSASVE